MHIRQLGPDDTQSFLAFRAAGLSSDSDAFRVTPADDARISSDLWSSRLARDYVVAAIEPSGQWLGVGGLSQFEGEMLQHKGLIWGMYVSPKARESGAADKIMDALLSHAIGKVRQLQLTVMADNQRARAFYERHGFTTYGVEPESVWQHGVFADEALMQRFL